MRLFRKVKGLVLGKEEIEIIFGQIYNYVARKKLVYRAELEPFFKACQAMKNSEFWSN